MSKDSWGITTLLLCTVLMTEAINEEEKSPDFWMTKGQDELIRATQRRYITHRARNVILFVGDGMGVSTVTAARILKGQLKGNSGEEAKLSFEEFPNVALSKTYSVDYQTTDSASTATAFLSGVKTNKGTLGVSGMVDLGDCPASQQHSVSSALDWALESGRSVGIVTTTRVTHATPASAFAHSADRDWEGDWEMPAEVIRQGCRDIAAQLVDSQPNIKEWLAEKQSRDLKARYVWNAADFDAVDPDSTDFLLGLFEPSHMNFELDRTRLPGRTEAGEPSLAEMVEKAVKILRRSKKGFFLLVEGGRIDHGHHASMATRALHETLALDAAVTTAMTLTKERDTLIVVTADHSHVMVLSGYPTRGNPILGTVDTLRKDSDGKPYTAILYGNGPGYKVEDGSRPNITGQDTADKDFVQQSGVFMKSETHGGEDVAIFARGPSAHLFHGVHEQSYIAHVMGYAACMGSYASPDKCSHSADSGASNAASGMGNVAKSTASVVARMLRSVFRF